MAALVRAPMLANTGGDGVDVGRLVVIVADETQLRHPAPALQMRSDAVEDRCRGRAGILRVQRQHDESPHAGAAQLLERSGNAGRTVRHPERDRCRQMALERAANAVDEGASVQKER